jgi:hypothetical protein
MSNYLTAEDEQAYGRDLLNVSQRAAMHAVAPHLQTLSQQNEALLRGLAQERRHRLDQQVEQLVPDYREVDRDPSWHRWLLGVDPMSGRVRQALLDDAIRKGNAARVKNFFDQFRDQYEPTGGGGSISSSARRSRAAAVKPTYTRSQIHALYEAHRKGAYQGREAEWARIEQDIFDSQREGRIVGPPWISK